MTTVAENRFESLVSELISKCNISREKLSELIQQKREKVGGGYLTDQGALFLVAAELGVVIDYGHEKPATLSLLPKDQTSVTVTSRILSVGYPKTFTRKTDSRKGLLSRVVIYDNSASISMSLWDGAASKFFGKDIRPGDLVKISNAYARRAIDGSTTLSFGERSSIEKITGETNSLRIQNLEEKIQPFPKIPENGRALVVRGKVVGETRRTGFTRRDGSSSDRTTFTICDPLNQSLKYRVVVWENPNPVFASLKDSEVITLLNVRTRLSNFQNSVAVEIHGDETTCILERWEETRAWMKDLAKDSPPPDEQSTKSASGHLPFIARIVAIRQSDEAKAHLLLVDSQKRKISVTASGEVLKQIGQLNEDDVVVVRPETFDSIALKASIVIERSIAKSSSKRSDIPRAESLLTTIEKLQETGIVSLDIMCLTDSIGREIQTREGLVKRTEITAADHTGEIKVYGWRDLSKLLQRCSAGDRVTLCAVEVQTHERKKFLVLKNYSGVKKHES